MAANRHFWALTEASALKIANIEHQGPECTREDVTWHAWEEILRLYFPSQSAIAGGPQYSIEREAYRGLPPENPYSRRPDIIVIRFHNIQQQQGMPPTYSERDILWIECKPPHPNIPSKWKDVINQAVERLSVAHSGRSVYLILALGLKWMPFLWNPGVPANPPLEVWKHNRQGTWVLDPRIHMIRPANLLHQRHVVSHNRKRIVDTGLAYSLDYWSEDENGNIANLPDLLLLENFFALIQNTQYQGLNPPSF